MFKSRTHRLLMNCFKDEDQVTEGDKNMKVSSGDNFWREKKKGIWFCNRGFSPIKNNDGNVKNKESSDLKQKLQNKIPSPRGRSSAYDTSENKNEISSSSDLNGTSGDSSYIPETEVSSSEVSSVLMSSPPDFNIYTPSPSPNPNSINADEDLRLGLNCDAADNVDVIEAVELPEIEENCVSSTREDILDPIFDHALPLSISINENIASTSGIVSLNVEEDGVLILNDNCENESINIKKSRRSSQSRNYCYYCEDHVLNFARHIISKHSTELEVIKLSLLPPKSLERKRLLARLRNKGNYLKTANNCPRRVRRAQIVGMPVLPCDNCLGFFSSKLLYRHRKNCSGKTGRAQSEGQTLLIQNRVDERLKREIFPRMRADKISLEAKADSLICSFGTRYLKTHRAKQFVIVTSRKMRELSKILIELKKLEPQIKSLFQALQPKYYNLFVQATQTVAGFDPLTDSFEAPSFAMNIVTSLKECCNIAINVILTEDQQFDTIPGAEAQAQLKTMINLFEANWRYDISSQAATNLNVNKWNKITIVPLASDLKILRNYLLQSASKASKKLQIDKTDICAYNTLVETVYCRVLLLNRKRPGELQRMMLHTYLNSGNDKGQYEEFDSIITPSERILLRKLKRVVIRGKRERGVPVLFSVDVQENVQQILDVRSNFVPKNNVYLFAKANATTEISGYKILRKYAYLCGAKNPQSITSTRLRKHLATLTQIFNMTDSDIEQLATFMGHTTGIHRSSYRLPDDVYQTAKLSKLLLLMEKGEAGSYKGKNLEDIDLDMEENLFNDVENDENGMNGEGNIMDAEMDLASTEKENQINVNEISPDKPSNPSNIEKQLQNKKQKRLLIPWTSQQKQLTKMFFKDHIKNCRPPRKNECEKLIENYPEVFSNKTWLKIKVYVQNEYIKKQNYLE